MRTLRERARRTSILLTGPMLAVALSAAAAEAPRPLLITVDDLPISAGSLHSTPLDRERITRGMLAALERQGIHAVGLVTWRNVRDDGDLRLLEMWLDAGHELGNHSYGHRDYSRTEKDAYIADVERGHEELARFLATREAESRFFRFPMLHEGETPEKLAAMRAYLERSGQRNLPVTLDNQDWSFERPWVEARREEDEARMRDVGEDYLAALRLSIRHHENTGDRLFGRRLPQILLLHATEVGAVHWERLFAWLKRSNHRFASADEVLSDEIFDRAHAYVGRSGLGLWDRLGAAIAEERAREEIRKLLDTQAAAWTAGDLDAFCSVYDEQARFVSPSGLTQGRQEILERYRRRYANRAAMGQLSLEIVELRTVAGLEVSMLGDSRLGGIHGASVVARWRLSYPDKEDATGLTLLVLHRQAGGWRIVQDASM